MKKYSSFINEGKKSNKDIIHSVLLEYVEGVGYNWNYITPEELNKEDLRDFYLLDIRRKEDYEEGHITGAKNIFWKDLLKEENIKKLPKNKKIILICYVGHTSSQMMVALSLLGYNVLTLKFGMGKSPIKGIPVSGWLGFGYNIKKGKEE